MVRVLGVVLMLYCPFHYESIYHINPDDLFFYPFVGYALLLLIPVILWQYRFALPFRTRGFCKKCHDDLRSNPEAGCPECGWGREGAEVAREVSR